MQHTITTTAYITAVISMYMVGASLPAVPAIAASLNISPHTFQVFSATLMVAYTIGIYLFTLLSNKLGRKPSLYIGWIFNGLAFTIVLSTHQLSDWIVAGVLFGFGSSANSLICRLLISDSFTGPELQSKASLLTSLFQMALPLCPLVGGFLLSHYDWESIFYVGIAFSLIQLLMFTVINETKAHFNPKVETYRRLSLEFFSVLRFKPVVGYGLIALFGGMGLAAWLNMSPVVMIHHYGFSPTHYSYIMLITNFIPAFIGIFNGKLLKYLSSKRILVTAIILCLLASIAQIIFNTLYVNITAQIFCVTLMNFGVTLISSNSFIGLINHLTDDMKMHLGSAVGMYTTWWLLGLSIASGIAVSFNETTLLILGIIGLTSSAVTFVSYSIMVRQD
ncbi:MAG: MFS transporter [Pseudomonadota bacterium]|nr:MFS transporter [Pseudomonadota bacterium]